ncbi:PilZ domain-containing protein [Neobacillus mesonae]|nr:PilZ domain-containing protein [Neobacillus mesonae]
MTNMNQICESALIDCVAIVKTPQRSLSGRTSLIEGDVFEVMFETEADIPIPLGVSIGITIYSSEGLIVFDTYPVASYLQRILCILPPNFQKRILNRRKDVRVPVRHLPSYLESLQLQASMNPYVFENGLPCDVKNISLGGLMFAIESPLPIQVKDIVCLNLGEKIRLSAIIRHHQDFELEYRYGAEFTDMSEQHIHTLKSIIINQQAANRPMQIGIQHYLNE